MAALQQVAQQLSLLRVQGGVQAREVVLIGGSRVQAGWGGRIEERVRARLCSGRRDRSQLVVVVVVGGLLSRSWGWLQVTDRQ